MTGSLKLPVSPQAQAKIDKLLKAFGAGAPLEEEDAHELKQLVLDIGWEIHQDRGGNSREEADRITEQLLTEAELEPGLSFQEVLLKRLVRDPSRAHRYVGQKLEAVSKRNKAIASKPRPSRGDWWTDHIEDCLEDNPEANEQFVREYLLDMDEVEWRDNKFQHVSHAAGPLSKPALHSRIGTAKRRMQAEG